MEGGMAFKHKRKLNKVQSGGWEARINIYIHIYIYVVEKFRVKDGRQECFYMISNFSFNMQQTYT